MDAQAGSLWHKTADLDLGVENPGSRVSKISGTRSSLTDNIPVIFLLKTEADILLGLMAGSDKRNVSITGGLRSRLDMNNLQLFLQNITYFGTLWSK